MSTLDDARGFSISRMPCANISNAASSGTSGCVKEGTAACSSCGLVSYCSKECQKTHWILHKKDCKHSLRAQNWRPAWIIENREPSFMSVGDMSVDLLNTAHGFEYAVSQTHLWGNMPARDLLNMPSENIPKSFSVMLTASGDMRHVMKTVNSFPEGYSGNISIALNDKAPHVVARNLLLLLVLGTLPNATLAADIALHLWFSLRIPSAYHEEALRIYRQTIKPALSIPTKEARIQLGQTSALFTRKSSNVLFMVDCTLTSDYDTRVLDQEIQKVFFASARKDNLERHIASLQPSHRLGFVTQRRSGVVLPFGASAAAFSYPNRTLFRPNGMWIMSDSVSPLDGWNIDDVLARGKACGAHRSDLFGCLYFYLSYELRNFAERIRRMNITFHLTDVDSHELAIGIPRRKYVHCGLAPTVRFDRIDVLNTIDFNYLGISSVLKDWASLLKGSTTTTELKPTIVGFFMN